jgi:tetratricopeptide (TPR) repeat protein
VAVRDPAGLRRRLRLARFAAVFLVVPPPSGVLASPASTELRRQGFTYANNLDYDRATECFRQAAASDPQDAGAYRGLATVAWMQMLFERGSISVDGYLGWSSRDTLKVGTPRVDLTAEFRARVDRALQLAEARLQAHPGDADCLYEVGAAVGQQAAFVATIEGRVLGAVRAARRAYDAHSRLLTLAPTRKDAGLIVGTYRYLVASLSLVKRWMAYLAGFDGGREEAIRLLESSASYPSDVQAQSRLALLLAYSREGMHDRATALLEQMRTDYPRNRLLWLESGAVELRAGRAGRALERLDTGLAAFARDPRPKAWGEAAHWHLKRGAALVALNRLEEATHDLRLAAGLEGRDWLHGRVQIELGKAHDLGGNRSAAVLAYRSALVFCLRDDDTLGRAEAERLIRAPYRGTNLGASRQN